jgi:hypothetical protein
VMGATKQSLSFCHSEERWMCVVGGERRENPFNISSTALGHNFIIKVVPVAIKLAYQIVFLLSAPFL